MAIPGFDKTFYLNAKLEQLQSDSATAADWAGKDVAFLEARLLNGFGLTAEAHYEQYGYQEDLAPNAFFNPAEYIRAKATDMFNDPASSYLTIDEAAADFVSIWNGNVYNHYLQYGEGENINPSNSFDVSAYLETKLADLQAKEATAAEWAGKSVADVAAAFKASGLTALEHFTKFGQDEGLSAPAVPAEEQVEVDTSVPGQVFSLTTGVDNYPGTAGDDTIIAQDLPVNGANIQTFGALDSINGGEGTDTFNIFDQNNAINVSGSKVSNVEVANVEGNGAVTVDSRNWTGLETLNVNQAGGAVALNAAATTNVSASGNGDFATGVTGGNNVTVAQKMDAAGDAITVNGASGDVTVNATESASAAAGITLGGTTANTGAVTVTSSGNGGIAAGGNTGAALDTIAVTGGSTVNVTQSVDAVKDIATKAAVGDVVTQGAVTVTGGVNTTSVTVAQDDQVAAVAAVAAAGTAQEQTVTFNALVKGNSVTVNGLTFTASKDLTAEEVAQAFANLTSGDRQDDGGPTANGFYSGVNTATTFTSGAADGATVTYTAHLNNGGANNNGAGAAAINVATAQGTGTTAPTTPTVAVSQAGVAYVKGVDGVAGVANGLVTIDDTAANTITTVTVDGYSAGANIGLTAPGSTLGAITSLTLKNSGTGLAALDTTSTGALTLTLDDVDGVVNLDASGAATLTNLTINTEGTASTGAITAAAAKTVTINAEAKLSGASTFTAASLIDVNGSATVDLTGATTNAATLQTIDASGSTGGVTAVLGSTNAVKFTGGAGNDSLTLGAAAIATGDDIDMGAGDDTLKVAAGTTSATIVGSVEGGDGTDTLSMGYADAVAVSATSAFDGEVTGFERLTINNLVGDDDDTQDTFTVNLANLTYNYVTVSGVVADTGTLAGGGGGDNDTLDTDILALTGMENNGTVAFATTTLATDNYTVALADAAGTADVLNFALASTSQNLVNGVAVSDNTLGTANNGGTVTANGVETFNISTSAKDLDGAINVLNATGDALKAINVTGNASLDLTSAAATLTTVNASAAEGGLTFTAANASSTVTGGAGKDVLTISGSADSSVINGGAGDDTFIISAGADLVTITGGAGKDNFDFNGVSTNKSNYAVINGVDSGDTIDLAGLGVNAFNSTKITLAQGATESTQAYLDQAMTTLDANGSGWFQYNGNTYVAADVGVDSTNAFADGTDGVIMITGLVDMAAASFNSGTATIEIA